MHSELTLSIGMQGPVNNSIASAGDNSPNLMDLDVMLPIDLPSMHILPLHMIDLNEPAAVIPQELDNLLPLFSLQVQPALQEYNKATEVTSAKENDMLHMRNVTAAPQHIALVHEQGVLQVDDVVLQAAINLQGNATYYDSLKSDISLFPEIDHCNIPAIAHMVDANPILEEDVTEAIQEVPP